MSKALNLILAFGKCLLIALALIFFSCAVKLQAIGKKAIPEIFQSFPYYSSYTCNGGRFRLYLDSKKPQIKIEQGGLFRQTLLMIWSKDAQIYFQTGDKDLREFLNKHKKLPEGLLMLVFPDLLRESCCVFEDSLGNLYDEQKLIKVSFRGNTLILSVLDESLRELATRVVEIGSENLNFLVGKQTFYCEPEAQV